MSSATVEQVGEPATGQERATGEAAEHDEPFIKGLTGYLVGLALATALTAASFGAASTHLIWGPGIPAALLALAVAQMGIHLVFFLHLSTGPDNTNNVLALAFGVLIVALVVIGSLWIMAHLDHNMLPMERIIQMQR